nr:hypothetical protein [Duganella sp. BJB1802]
MVLTRPTAPRWLATAPTRKPVTVSAVDAQAIRKPTANLHVRFEASGAGAIIGVGNGDPNSHASEKAPERDLYNGLAQVIVQSRRGGQGGFAAAPALTACNRPRRCWRCGRWRRCRPRPRRSRWCAWAAGASRRRRPRPGSEPDAGRQRHEQLGFSAPPLRQAAEALRWRTYRAPLGLRGDRNDGRARLVFGEIAGRAEVWLDGVKLGEKGAAEAGPLSLPLPKGAAWRTLTVLVEAQPNQPSGLIGPVLVEPGAP